MLFRSACLASLLMYLVPAAAHAASDDSALWTAVHTQIRLDDKVSLTIEGQARFNDDASRLGQVLIRPSLNYQFSQTTRGALGYAFVQTRPSSLSKTNEHRLWQQVAYRVASWEGGMTLNGRTRLEQRWVEGRRDTGWRLRQQLRLSKPLTGQVSGVLSSELFVAANDTDWGQRSGLDRWRNSAGLSFPVTPKLTIEPGYIHQWVRRPGEDAVDHILNLSLTAQF